MENHPKLPLPRNTVVKNNKVIRDPKVMKHWHENSLISSFFRREDELYCLSLTDDVKGSFTVRRIPIDLPKLRSPDLLMESSNNIACLKATSGKFLVYNTLTGDSFVVDDVPLRHYSSRWLCCGFGYDPYDDDYKIVVNYFLESKESEIDVHMDSLFYVYSLRNRDWKSFEADFSRYAWNGLLSRHCSYSFNGILHWVVCKKPTPSYMEQRNKVVATLDLHTLQFSEIGLPTAGNLFIQTPYFTLGQLDGQLCCCAYTHTFGVWVMKEYGVHDSWTKLLTIDLFNMIGGEAFACEFYGSLMKSCAVYRCGEDGKFVIFFSHAYKVLFFKFDVYKDSLQVLYKSSWRKGRTLRWWKRCFKKCLGRSLCLF